MRKPNLRPSLLKFWCIGRWGGRFKPSLTNLTHWVAQLVSIWSCFLTYCPFVAIPVTCGSKCLTSSATFFTNSNTIGQVCFLMNRKVKHFVPFLLWISIDVFPSHMHRKSWSHGMEFWSKFWETAMSLVCLSIWLWFFLLKSSRKGHKRCRIAAITPKKHFHFQQL